MMDKQDHKFTTSKKKQAKRKLFYDGKQQPGLLMPPNQAQNSNTEKKQLYNGAVNFDGNSEGYPLSPQQMRIIKLTSADKNRNRNFDQNSHDQSRVSGIGTKADSQSPPPQVALFPARQVDSAGVIPEFEGTLPPVPTFSLVSPEIGLNAANIISGTYSRQKTGGQGQLDFVNYKRNAKLQAIVAPSSGHMNVPP